MIGKILLALSVGSRYCSSIRGVSDSSRLTEEETPPMQIIIGITLIYFGFHALPKSDVTPLAIDQIAMSRYTSGYQVLTPARSPNRVPRSRSCSLPPPALTRCLLEPWRLVLRSAFRASCPAGARHSQASAASCSLVASSSSLSGLCSGRDWEAGGGYGAKGLSTLPRPHRMGCT